MISQVVGVLRNRLIVEVLGSSGNQHAHIGTNADRDHVLVDLLTQTHAGTVDNFLAGEWAIDSNITVGAFRAPRSNFVAVAEQAFLDEVAEAVDKEPIEFQLELLRRAKSNPVGEDLDYEAERYRLSYLNAQERIMLIRRKNECFRGGANTLWITFL